jgi:alpha-tubulin suppressor-like RCC1 family protein
MNNRKMLLRASLSITLVFSLTLTVSMLNAAPVMARGQATRTVAADTMICAKDSSPPECDVGDWTDIIQVAAGYSHTVGLKSDGTVVAVGYGYAAEEGEKQPWEVDGWANISQVAGGEFYTVGLKTEGTVVAVGYNYYGQCDVASWTDISQVAAGLAHTVGLRSDGTVVAAGGNAFGQSEADNWTDIVQVAEGAFHTVGLESSGTVVAVGDNDQGQCNVAEWTGINQTAAGDEHTVGLKSDSTVVAVGYNEYGQCDVGNWTDITQVAAGEYHTVGLKLDGTVVAAGGYVSCALPSGRCFIATAAYGTPMAGEVQILRQFRDEYLLTNPLGQALVGLYYRVSPPIAGFITEHPSLKPIVRAGLVPAVAMSTLTMVTSPAEKAAIVGLLVLVSVALVVWTIKRWGRGT